MLASSITGTVCGTRFVGSVSGSGGGGPLGHTIFHNSESHPLPSSASPRRWLVRRALQEELIAVECSHMIDPEIFTHPVKGMLGDLYVLEYKVLNFRGHTTIQLNNYTAVACHATRYMI